MEHSRRDFLKKLGLASGAVAVTTVFTPQVLAATRRLSKKAEGLPAGEVARDEDFWYQVQSAYSQSPHFINLEAGYFSPQPNVVMEAQLRNIEMINEQPSFYMRRRQQKERQEIREMVAAFGETSPDEITITRNTTESLNVIILGYPWQPGDEAIITEQDYPNMREAFAQAEKRYKIKLAEIAIPLHPKSDAEIVAAYENAITPRTKVILCTHMINLTGQILPVRQICDMAHAREVEVIIDGAHTFAHLDFKIPDLHGDYYAASLHKWLCCPLGLGVLYVKKDKIEKIWPLFGDTTAPTDSITKFERTGTQPVGTILTVANALNFHNAIGSKRKEERLRYLKNYWCEKVKDIPGVTLNVPLEHDRSCAIGNVAVEGMTPDELEAFFYDKYRIFTVAINNKAVKGVRVTPHLYTTLENLDLLVDAIKVAAHA